MRRELRIKQFPAGPWQVVWYGPVAFASRLYSQPSITLRLARPSTGLELRAVQVPFSLIAVIPLGSIWNDGICVEARTDELETLSLTVRERDVRNARFGERLEGADSQYLLPFASFDQHREDTRAHGLWWKAADTVVVLPAVEAIRFYFGTSSDLLKRLITDSPERLWIEKSIDAAGAARLRLGVNVNRHSAAEVARIAFDDSALRAAQLPYRSLMLGAADPRSNYPNALLPFRGVSRLSVAGRTVKVDGGPDRFVVYRIDGCSAKYPFSSLSVEGGVDPKLRRGDETESDGSERASSRDAADIHTSEPSSSMERRSGYVWQGPRFVDLAKKAIRFGSPPTQSSPMDGARSGAEDEFGLGDGAPEGIGNQFDLMTADRPREIVAFVDVDCLTEAITMAEIDASFQVLRERLNVPHETARLVVVLRAEHEREVDAERYCVREHHADPGEALRVTIATWVARDELWKHRQYIAFSPIPAAPGAADWIEVASMESLPEVIQAAVSRIVDLRTPTEP